MKVAEKASELEEAWNLARSEAKSGFGDDTVYLERYLANPRHIEFQLFADSFGNVVHFGERDCSLQRRHQKVLEEAPSPAINEEERVKISKVIVKAVKKLGYLGAGTFEMLYENLKAQETISFWSTSFLRGTTLDNAVIIVDECQNLNFHELDSIMTRIGQDSKIVFCGDVNQSDLQKTNERNGILDFQRILENMEEFSMVEYGVQDIVRSGLVKSYLISKLTLGL